MAAQTTKDTINLLLVGKTGVGKSSTGNTIIGQRRFKSAATQAVVTRECKAEYAHVLGRKVKVVDLPGLADVMLDEAGNVNKVIKEIMTAVAETPDGYDAILIVIALGRQTMEDLKIITQLKAILGDNFIAEFGILLITHCDQFDPEENDDQTIEEWCSSEDGIIKDLLKECRDRVVFFHNRSTDSKLKESELNHLLSIVDEMKSGPRYLSKHFEAAQAERLKLLANSEEQRVFEKITEPIRLMMNDLDGINVEECPETAILKLRDLLRQAEELRNEVASQDNSTGGLDSALNMIKTVEQAVHDRLWFAESVQKNRELQAQFEKMTAENEEERQKLRWQLEENNLEKQKLEQKQKQEREEAEKIYEEFIEKQNKELRNKIIIALVAAAVGFVIPAVVAGAVAVGTIPAVLTLTGLTVRAVAPSAISTVVSAAAAGVVPNIYQAIKKRTEKKKEENKEKK